MDENLHNIDDLFRQALNEHDESVSPDVWKNIDKNLDKKKIISISKSYQKLKWVAAALLIFSAGMAMYTFRSKIRFSEIAYKNKIDRKSTINKQSGIDKNVAINDIQNIRANRKKMTDADQRKQDNDSLNNQSKNQTNSSINKQSLTAVDKNVVKNLYQSKTNKENQTIKTKPIIATAFANESENAFKLDKTKRANDVLIKNKGFFKNEVNLNTTKPIADAIIISESKQQTHSEATDSSLQNVLESLKSAQHFFSAISQNSVSPQLSSKAAKSKIKGIKKSLFSATLFFSPDFVASRVDNDDNRFREEDRDEIKNNEKIKKASTAGFLVNYDVTKRFSIQTGIAFSNITTDIFPKTIYARPDDRGVIGYRFNCSAGYSNITFRPENPPASGDSISSLFSTSTLKYISVPLTLQYRITEGRFSLQPGLGLAANFLTKGTIQTQIAGASNQKENIEHVDGLNKVYVNSLLSLSLNYNVNKIFSVNFTPVSRFALTSINKNTPVKTYFNSLGLQAGISLRL